MDNSAHFLQKKPIFYGKQTPEEGSIVGYVAIIDTLNLKMPMVKPIALVCDQNKNYSTKDWLILPKSYLQEVNQKINKIGALYKYLIFLLKYQGFNLLLFSHLTKHYSDAQLTAMKI